jgi:integrase
LLPDRYLGLRLRLSQWHSAIKATSDRLTLPTGKSEVFHFDARCPGLSVRIQRTGKPSFVTWFTTAGKRKRITLGAVAGMDLDQARRQATEIVNAGRDGRDPGKERKLARIAAADVPTVGGLIGAYLREHAERHQRPRTLVETRRNLQRHLAPLHALLAGDVTRREVSARLLELARSTGTAGANRARANLSAAFVWAMKAGLIDHNPVIGTVKGEESTRERVLTIKELAAIWQATAELRRHDAIVRLLMLTGQRRAEIGGLAWAELDRANALVTLSGQRTKNGRLHEVPLSRQASAILREFPELPRCPYIFGRRGQVPFAGWSRCKERLDGRIAEQQGAPLAPWTIHDIRRSFATLAIEHGLIEPFHVEAILNHVSGHRNGVAGIYNRAVYREPKRIGLQRWADWLESMVRDRTATRNVVVSLSR